jgi:hypothetical protein
MWTMFRLLRNSLRDRLKAMPVDRAIAEAYRQHLEAGDWSCVAMLDLVTRIQAAHPELSQSAAVTRVIAIIKRVQQS